MGTHREPRFRDYVGLVLAFLVVVLILGGMCAGAWLLNNAVIEPIIERTEPASIYMLLGIGYLTIIVSFLRRFIAKRRQVSGRTPFVNDTVYPPI